MPMAAHGQGGAEPPRLRVRTFGGLAAWVDGRPLGPADWQGHTTALLLKTLIALGGTAVPTQRLADLLWPEHDGARALQNLKVALWRLRHRALSHQGLRLQALEVRHGQVSIVSAACEVDALRFAGVDPEAPAEALRDALALYEGDFLPGDDEPPPIAERREALRRRFVHLALRLADHAVPEAGWHLERALQAEPMNEQVIARLMRWHADAGREAQALHVYDLARQRFARALACAPGRALQALAQQLRQRASDALGFDLA